MKTLKRFYHNRAGQPAIQTRAIVAMTVALSAGFWLVTAPSLFGGAAPQCMVCHKRDTTLTFPCNSLQYRRHLDHGDPMGACPASRGARTVSAKKAVRR